MKQDYSTRKISVGGADMKKLAVVSVSIKLLSLALLSLAVTTGCTSDSSQPAASKPQPPDLLAGRAAFQHLYVAARGWAQDIKPYQLQSQAVGDYKVLADAPDTPVSYLLDWNPGTNNLVWHVIYGNSRNDAKLVADLDASTGEFIRKEK